jgi:hypothetical protein
LRSEFADQLCGSGGGAACGEQIIYQQNAAAGFKRVHVNGHSGRAIFQSVILLVSLIGQFALLTHGHEARAQPDGDSRGKDETACINSNHRVHVARLEIIGQLINHVGE